MNTTVRRLASAGSGLILLGLSVPAAAATGAGAMTSGGIVHIVRGFHAGVNTNQSSNWSGYNIGADYPQVSTGTLFTSISGEWTVPTATEHGSDTAEDSATWVGIGGGCVEDSCTLTDSTLIQAGTEQDVSSSGKASYDAWYELIPETETEVSLPVKAGNKVQVTISETSTAGEWSIVIKNLTTHKSFSTTQAYSSSEDTVEWIEETPLEIGTGGTGIATMPNLTKVHIFDATYNGSNPAFQAIDEMQLDNNSQIEATPSGPVSSKNGFYDCTWASSCTT